LNKAPYLPKLKTMQFQQQVEGLPEKPGVYLFKDSKGEIIYIGKAKDLRKRVRSYLHGQKDLKTSVMLSKVAEVDHMVTETEKEALILEDALVKEHKPRYNIKLRDDKNYPLLRLSVQDRYPRLTLVRRVKADGALYFGPFPSAQSVRETMRLIHWVFPLRRCSDSQFSHRSRPCLNFQMRRCLAPCCRRVPEERYRAIVDQVRQFLEGEGEKVLKGLEEQMRKEAEALNFEEAARLRDRITALRKVLERQRVVSLDLADRDVIAMLRHRGKVGVYVLSIRGGKLLGGRFFDFKDVGLPDQEVLSSFLSRYYSRGRYVPPEVVVPFELEDASLIEASLGVKVNTPRDERQGDMLKMALENARGKFMGEGKDVLEELKGRFHLRQVPRRIEAFDISNLGGEVAVGSMVVFLDGEPARDQYRRFRIKGVRGIDDYAMTYEVLKRRLQRGSEEGVLPQLLLIDGGKGQLRIALEVLKELGIEDVDCLSIAKQRPPAAEEDRLFLPRAKDPLPLKDRKPSTLLLKRIRDEAHRFALSYHRRLRDKERLASVLDRIPGIGEAKKLALLRHFGGVKGLREASEEELTRVPGIGPRLAACIRRHLQEVEP